MAQISKGDTFVDGQQVTGARLNQLVDSSVLLVGAITDQPSITANTLEATDSTIVNDAGVLKEATIGDILNSNLPITTSSITGGAGVDITVTPAAGQKMDVGGAFEADDINVTDDLTVGDDASVGGDLTVAGTTTLTGDATASGNLTVVGNLTSGGVAVQNRLNVAIFTREITSGTQHIYASSGSWLDNNFNTLTQVNSFIVNSASFTNVVNSAGTGTITLPAGTYEIEAESYNQSQGGAGTVVVRVRNETTGTQIKKGNVGHCANFAGGYSTVHCLVTFASQTDIKIQTMVGVVGSTGYANSDGTSEQVFYAKITKLA